MIYVIRHCESVFNGHGIAYLDSDLTKRGVEQAKKINLEVDLVICSTLCRTQQTLLHSSIKHKGLLISDLCREFKNGNIINYLDGEVIKIETELELSERLKDFWKLVNSLYESHKTIAIISHQGFILKSCGLELQNGQIVEFKKI